MTGVYKIQNTISGNFYIGSSATDVINRIRRHKRDLNDGAHHCQPLQRAWLKYGEGAFKFEVLMATPKEQAVPVEQIYMDWLKPEYNTCKIAGSALGVKRSKEYGAAISERMQGNTIWRGRTHTEEAKAKIALGNKGKMPHTWGKNHSPETVEKIRSILTGQKRTEEQKARMSAASKRKKPWNTGLVGATKAWNRGLKFKPETVIKMREAKLKYNWAVINIETQEIFETNNLTQFCKDKNLLVTNLHLINKNGSFRLHRGYQVISKQPIK